MSTALSRKPVVPESRHASGELDAIDREQIKRLCDPWPDSWRELGFSIYSTLRRIKPLADYLTITEETEKLVRGIADDLGGMQIYVAFGLQLGKEAVYTDIVKRLQETRNDYALVAREYNKSERWIRKVEGAYLLELRARAQHRLPGLDTDS